MPLISAVIPSYNYGRFVCEAVESALAQTHPAIEVIVVDDGSTDDTRERLARYGDRIRYIYQPNQGLSAARNTGIRHARGDWIALLDADDIWHPRKTEMQLAIAASVDNCGLVGSLPADKLPETLPAHPAVKHVSICELLLSIPVGPSSALIRTDAFEKAGLFDESLRCVEDRDMWLRLASHVSCVQVDSPCWWYRSHTGQMNRNAPRMFDNYRAVLGKFFAEHPEHRDLRRAAWSYFYADSAWTHFEQGYRTTALAHVLYSFLLHPRGYKTSVRQRRWWRSKASIRYLVGTRFCRLLRPDIR